MGDKGDLIHVVLNAVEENWLNQAPQPTLDKAQALLGQEHVTVASELSELSESEKGSHELEIIKNEQRQLDSEATLKLWPKKSFTTATSSSPFATSSMTEGDEEDLPYLESTLPQERHGFTVTITPSCKRLSAECKLTSMSRPSRSTNIIHNNQPSIPSMSLKNQELRSGKEEKIKVLLPKQDSKARIRPSPESWESFARKGLQTFKGHDMSYESSSPKIWVNCEALPQPRKVPKRYDSNEERLDDDIKADFSFSSSPPSVPGLMTEKTHPMQPPPLPLRVTPVSSPATLPRLAKKPSPPVRTNSSLPRSEV